MSLAKLNSMQKNQDAIVGCGFVEEIGTGIDDILPLVGTFTFADIKRIIRAWLDNEDPSHWGAMEHRLDDAIEERRHRTSASYERDRAFNLTPEELDVLERSIEGENHKAIAFVMKITEDDVKSRIQTIKNKICPDTADGPNALVKAAIIYDRTKRG